VRRAISSYGEGWSEATTLFDATLGAVLEIQAKSAGRLAESKEEGVATLAAMTCFERPTTKADPGVQT
jgi:hypothetical protein